MTIPNNVAQAISGLTLSGITTIKETGGGVNDQGTNKATRKKLAKAVEDESVVSITLNVAVDAAMRLGTTIKFNREGKKWLLEPRKQVK